LDDIDEAPVALWRRTAEQAGAGRNVEGGKDGIEAPRSWDGMAA